MNPLVMIYAAVMNHTVFIMTHILVPTVIMNHIVVMSRTVVVTAADSCFYLCHFVVMTDPVVMNY